jgi:hypothetical protein
MKVNSEFLSRLSSYVDGKVDLEAFREWYLPLLLDREKLGSEEQQMLFTFEARYGELLAGVSEDAFKESLRSLLPQEPMQALVRYESESWTKSTVTIMFFDPSPLPDQSALVNVPCASTQLNYVKDLIAAHA